MYTEQYFSHKFKKQTADLILESCCSVASVADTIGVHENIIHEWIRFYSSMNITVLPNKLKYKSPNKALLDIQLLRIKDLEIENALLTSENERLRTQVS